MGSKKSASSDDSDEEKKKEKPKPFMRETLSGRQPKPPERYAEKKPKKKKEKSDKPKHLSSNSSSSALSNLGKKDKKSHSKSLSIDKSSPNHRKKLKEPKIPPLSSKVKKLITSSDEDDDDDEDDDEDEPMDTEEDTHYSPPLEGIRKTSEKSYQRQSSAPHVHFEVTSSQTSSSQCSPALSTASTSSSAS